MSGPRDRSGGQPEPAQGGGEGARLLHGIGDRRGVLLEGRSLHRRPQHPHRPRRGVSHHRRAEQRHVGGAHQLGRPRHGGPHGPRVRGGDDGEGADPIGVIGGDCPGHRAAPVVAGHREAAGAELVGEGEHVLGEVLEPVGRRRSGPGAGAVAPLGRRHGVVAGRRQPVDDRAPRAGQLREAVEEQDEGPVRWAGGDGVEAEVAA